MKESRLLVSIYNVLYALRENQTMQSSLTPCQRAWFDELREEYYKLVDSKGDKKS